MSESINKNDIESLLSQCALRDALAFEQLYHLTSAKLFALVLRIVHKQEWAEDVLQEAYINIWNNASRFRSEKASAMTWMTRVVRNKAIDYIRGKPQSVWQGEDGLSDLMASDQGPFDSLYNKQQATLLRECLEQLEPSQQDTLVMAYFYGLTHLELAESLAKPLGTIKSWIRRGLLRLKRCVDK